MVTFDEMQSGFGRTGPLFGYEHYGVEPDVLACGKGASSSVPLSLLLGPARLLDLPESMGSTHSANPVSCTDLAVSTCSHLLLYRTTYQSERVGAANLTGGCG